MAKRDDILGVTGATTVIGSGVTLNGKLASEEDILVDGHLNGEIETVGEVTVGINGVIKGPIKAEGVTIAGSVHGNIQAESEVIIRESGQLRGSVKAAGLSIIPGGVFVGTNTLNDNGRLSQSADSE